MNKTIRDNVTSYIIEYVTLLYDILNPKGFKNCIFGSKVTAILPDGWILPIGGVALERVCN